MRSPVADCREPTRLVHASSALSLGARAGPVWLILGERGQTRATIHLTAKYPSALFPTKVHIYARRQLEADVTMRGWRCSDRRPLRFWYHDPSRLVAPRNGFSEARLRRMGEPVATLIAGRPDTDNPVLTYTRFILFSAPGMWKILVEQRDDVVGDVTLRVLSRPRPRSRTP